MKCIASWHHNSTAASCGSCKILLLLEQVLRTYVRLVGEGLPQCAGVLGKGWRQSGSMLLQQGGVCAGPADLRGCML